jgi:hypothetical protein
MANLPALQAILCLGLLSGCASQSQPSAVAPAATVTMDEAKAALMGARSAWKDPDSIKGTMIGQPYSSGCWGHAEHWVQKVDACVCVATNAKNSYGGYIGLKNQVALIQGRRVLDMIDARSHDQCSNLVPWPEFDGRTRS